MLEYRIRQTQANQYLPLSITAAGTIGEQHLSWTECWKSGVSKQYEIKERTDNDAEWCWLQSYCRSLFEFRFKACHPLEKTKLTLEMTKNIWNGFTSINQRLKMTGQMKDISTEKHKNIYTNVKSFMLRTENPSTLFVR